MLDMGHATIRTNTQLIRYHVRICSHYNIFPLFAGNSIAYRDATVRFGSGSGPILIDQLSCAGLESALLDCPARPLGLAECNIDDIAGVQCTGWYSDLHI